jgi:hypothetical protein
MTLQAAQSKVKEKTKKKPTVSGTREKLDEMKERLPRKPGLFQMIQDLLKDFKKLDSKERQKRIAAILSTAALGWLLGKKVEKKTVKEKKGKEGFKKEEGATKEVAAQEDETEEVEEEEVEESPREKRRRVACADLRLICINTDPVYKKRGSARLKKHNSTDLLKYGLPADYETFKEEMIDILAPDAGSEKEGVQRATKLLKWSPMGKYQCMPRYLFPFINFPFDGEKGLHAMWQFLQSEELQRNACRGYIKKLGTKNPRYIAAAYYGGPDEIAKIKAIEKEQATEKQKHDIHKGQSGYPSIWKYANSVAAKYQRRAGSGGFNMEAMLDAIAAQESGYLEGKIAIERNEKWEEDKRYAYNRKTEQGNETQIA